MTKNEARNTLVMLSYGTLASLTGVREFDKLDDLLSAKLDTIENTDVTECSEWQDVWRKLEQKGAEKNATHCRL
ncbi:MAG TPA: hypothetical protein VFC84_04760 [Desulfosporosinus sp.]|nr:hypothetical protein [Desulfosporosinus sp.]